MTIGISVSLYDKFDDLGILVDIIRDNWEDDYYISVCSNHPDAHERMGSLKSRVDNFEKGAQITYDPAEDGFRSEANRWYRVYNTIRTACTGALSGENVEYMVHVHADAWMLSEQNLHSLVQEMETNDASVAFKTETDIFADRYPPGYLMDQFMIFDAADANDVDLFEREGIDFPPVAASHYILPMLFLVKFGWSGMYHYSNRTEEQHWDGKPVTTVNNAARPMLYNPVYDQLHVASEDFRDNLGRSLQAHYLHKYGLTNGENIDYLLSKYKIPEENLMTALDEFINDLNSRLRWYGLSVDSERFGRDMRLIKPFLETDSQFQKIKKIVGVRTEDTLLGGLLRKLYRGYEGQKRPSDSEKNVKNETNKTRLLHEYYSIRLDQSDFPNGMLDE